MRIVSNSGKFMDVADTGLSIYDKDRAEYRLTLWEEDDILHVMFNEPVVIATQEDDVIGGRYRMPRVDSTIEEALKKAGAA